MPGIHTLQQAVKAIKEGSLDEAGRLIHIALEDPAMQHGALRALAYVTLARTKHDRDFQIDCYEKAIEADPESEAGKKAQNYLSQLLTYDLDSVFVEPQTTQNQSVANTDTNSVTSNLVHIEVTRTVGINGTQTGTGFFISKDGYIATTRRLIRGLEKVTVDIAKQGSYEGRIIYANTSIDLALVKIDVAITQLAPFTMQSYVPENINLIAYPYEGRVLQGRCRSTKRNISGEWIPTTFTQLVDGGGNPIFNEQQQLVGMLTHISGRSSDHLFGIHIKKILDELQSYVTATTSRPDLTYCDTCGGLSRAKSVGGYYCERCGGILSYAQNVNRLPNSKLAYLYGEDMHRKCVSCQSQIGYHDGKCLRCGNIM